MPKLSEEDISDLKTYEENIIYILEAMNLSYFSTEFPIDQTKNNLLKYECKLPNLEYKAYMIKQDEIYILTAGSYLKKESKQNFEKRNSGYYSKWYKITNSNDVENINENVCCLKVDLEFSSPSAAGAMVRAAATNGLITWKNTDTGKTIKAELLEIEKE